MRDMPFDFAIRDYPLAPMTRYNVGGSASVALVPRTIDEACRAYEWLVSSGDSYFVLGGGSNVLIPDEGFPGVVLITTGLDAVEPLGDDRYRVQAGCELDELMHAVILPNNYAGTGGLAGIPGSVGGAIYMNAGTVNGTTCQLIESVDVIGPDGHRTIAIQPEMYGYRGQRFCPAGHLILQGIFRFHKAEEDQQAVYDHYIQRRVRVQPRGYCCGSVFRNPEGDHAGRLIEACGLKGTRRGGAVISELHANFIMNEDGATFADIRSLIDLCRQTVLERFGILLKEEVITVGKDGIPQREPGG